MEVPLHTLENRVHQKIISHAFNKLIKYFIHPAFHPFISHMKMHTLQFSSPPKLDLSNPSVLLALKFLTLHCRENEDLQFVCYLRIVTDPIR